MTSMLFEDLPALFGAELPKDGLMGVLVVTHPSNGCTPVDPPPPLSPLFDINVTKSIALIRRFDCNFDLKVLHAQQAGYSAAIIHNVYSDILLHMDYSNETIAKEIMIPSVFTSYFAAKTLKESIIPEQGAYVILKPEFSFPFSYYLIPFTGVVGMIIFVMCAIMIIRCVQYRKRMRKNRLSKEQLKRIPIHKFRKGDDYDVCAICLDDYEEGDKLRVLPCSHGTSTLYTASALWMLTEGFNDFEMVFFPAYHCKCVDPWLTKTKKTCPVCKQRVTQKNPEHSDSESEEESGARGDGEGAEEEAQSERTPLLRASSPDSP
ncbi:unnamed protein product, partial [Tetraodon nigroviridis]